MTTHINGLLVLDKPPGITSRAALDRAAEWFPRKTRIGHAGTLDPLATGVLVLCIGSATRLTEFVQQMPKIYRAGIHLGAASDSDDADGIITPTVNTPILQRADVDRALSAFLGQIEQVPPAFSAAKVAGRRAYDLARKGKEVTLMPRIVRIDRIDIAAYEYPRLEITVHCGKGTYIRSLARDLGQALGCGGYIAALRRLAIGAFTETRAVPLSAAADFARGQLLPSWRAVQETPPVQLPDDDVAKLRQGRSIPVPPGIRADHAAVADAAGRMVAVIAISDSIARPVKVFSEPEA